MRWMMTSKKQGYLGNENLKASGVDIEFTKDQIKEYIKCSQDPVYFVEKYVKVVSLDEGLVPFGMYDYQKDIVDKVHNNRFVIAKLPRQSGKSTTIVSYILHDVLFNQSMNVAILANKQATKEVGEEGKNEYIPIEVHWSEVPLYPGGPLRGEKWREETIANTSEQQFQSEFECDFVGSQNTLISSLKLKSLSWIKPLEKSNDGLSVYEQPQENRQYSCVVDTSRGQGLDYSAFVMVDVTETPYKVVAKYRNNIISPLVYPTVIRSVCEKYNKAFCLIEINDIGAQVADVLYQDLEYDHVYMTQNKGRKGQVVGGGFGGGGNQFGVRTTGPVKKLGCSVLKSLIEEDKLIVEDIDTINELTTFIAKRQSFEADDGHTDDLVMCLVLFAWLTRQDYFKEMMNTDVRKVIYGDQIKQIEDDLLPDGFFDNGDSIEMGEYDGQDRWF
jgi:hypothetical protein